MEKHKAWLLLCKPCSVTLKKLPDSVINKWRKRTTQLRRPYTSRKRSGDKEIYCCRLLRPKRKLQYSQDAIDCIPYPYDDEDDKIENHEDGNKQINPDELIPKSHNLSPLPKINEDDSITPVWKYKRKIRKISPELNEKVDNINNHQSSNHQTLQNLKSTDHDEAKIEVQIQRELKLILWRLEDSNDDDIYLHAWKSKNDSQKHLDQVVTNKDIVQENILNNSSCKLKEKHELLSKSSELNSNISSVVQKEEKERPDNKNVDTCINVQKSFSEIIDKEQLINLQEKEKNFSGNAKKNANEKRTVKIVRSDDSNNDDLIIDVVNSEETPSTKTSSDIVENVIASITTPTICSCHSDNRLRNDLIVQIEMVLYCEICNTLYRRSECFEVHYRHSSKCSNERGKGRLPKLFCSTCHIVLHSLSEMRKHLEEHATVNFHRTVTFVCNICRVVFFGVGTVFCTHWFNHEKDPTFVASRWSFPKPCVSHEGIKPAGAGMNEQYLFVAEYVCRLCKLQFTSEGELSKHSCKSPLENSPMKTRSQSKKHLNTSTIKEPEPATLKSPELSEADFIDGLNNIYVWNCGFCINSFSTWTKFEEHSLNHLKIVGYPGYLCFLAKNKQPVYICNVCRHVSNSVSDLMKHWASHDIIKFVCSYCSNKFSTVKLLIIHIRLSCWKFKPGCLIELTYQQPFARGSNMGLNHFEETLQGDGKKSNNVDNTKSDITEANKTLKTLLKPNESSAVLNTSNSNLNNTITKYLLNNESMVNHDQNKQTLLNQSTSNISDSLRSIMKPIPFDKKMDLRNDNMSTSISSNTTLLNNTITNDSPVQLVSLILDDSGNIQVVPNNSGISFSTSGSNFQGPKVMTNSLPMIKNSNEILATNNIGSVVNKLVIKVVNNEQNNTLNNTHKSIVEQSRLITSIDNSINNGINEKSQEDQKDAVKIRSQEKVTNEHVKKVNITTVPAQSVPEPIIVDSSSSDHDSEILVEKICTNSENNHSIETPKDISINESKKIDNEVKIIGTSPNKTNSKPRPFLRVKNFSELQAIKNYTCRQCRAAFDNETSLNEHLNAHMNSLSRKSGNPTMRAALVLPVTETTLSESFNQQKTSYVASNIVGKRILPAIPQRVRNANARIAMPLANRNSREEQTYNRSIPQIVNEFSCSLCTFCTTTEEEFRQHLVLHCNETLSNGLDTSTVVNNSIQPNSKTSVTSTSQIIGNLLPNSSSATMTSVDLIKNRSKMFNCKLCSFSTFEKNDIIAHVATHCTKQPQMKASVPNCNEVLQSTLYYPPMNPNAITSLYPMYTCANCLNFKTNSCEELNQHIKNTHLISPKFVKYLHCSHCRLYFDNDETLKKHINTYHVNFCKVCLRRFEDYTDFVNHLCCPQKWK